MRAAHVLVLLCACAEAPPPAPAVATAPKPAAVTTDQDCPSADTAPPAEPPPPRFQTRTIASDDVRPRYVGRPIDLDVKGADIHDVCRLLADVGKINIILGDGVQGTVTLTMRHVPWDQVLDVVLAAKGLRVEREGNVILVFAGK